jgi:hypothetical protein
MEIIHLVRCGRAGNGYPEGQVLLDRDRLLTVITSNRINTAGHPGMLVCPKDHCWRIVNVAARLADDEEAVDFLEEEVHNAARADDVLDRERRLFHPQGRWDELKLSCPAIKLPALGSR